ncbi:MAG: cytochrome c [Acidobacteria bacterium]|nr:cytochrome c [Acidobacteriota bacterium]
MTDPRFLGVLATIAVVWSTAAQDRAPLTEEMITEEMLRQGATLLAEGTCSRCHARDGSGTNLGPDLADDEWLHGDGSLEAIRATIVSGVPRDQIKDPSRRQPMEPMGRMMIDDDQLDALAAFVWSLSR